MTLLPTADAGEEDRDEAAEEEAEGELTLEEVVDEALAVLLLLLGKCVEWLRAASVFCAAAVAAAAALATRSNCLM